VYGYVDPFLKWAGGKRFLIETLVSSLPPLAAEGTYFEPFVGGGAVFFALQPESAQLSDSNPYLIETYEAVRDDVERVIGYLKSFKTSAAAYYDIRRSRRRNAYSRAARFIYLNKLCFNGLYRENLAGEFNVPFGRHPKNHVVCDESQLRDASEALRGATLRTCDFEVAVEGAGAGDLVYFDPPYITGHRNNGFVEYNADVFSWDDQTRLARVAGELIDRGARVGVSNAMHASITRLYRRHASLTRVEIPRWSTMAGSPTKRFRTKEVLFVSDLEVADE
jgi:DNA adenine methylase